ncbi:MAG: hypothetical protein WD851_16085 [Pirellulales bacterium]
MDLCYHGGSWRRALLTAVFISSFVLGDVRAETLFEEQFNTANFENGEVPLGPGETWSAHGLGAPDVAMSVIQSGIRELLLMESSGAADGYRGIETTDPISLVGLAGVRVEVNLRPINQGENGTPVSAAVALLGSTGAFVEAGGGNNQPGDLMDWQDRFSDSLGTEALSPGFVHCAPAGGGCDGYRSFVLTVTSQGTLFQDFGLPLGGDPVELFRATSDVGIEDLSSLTIALRNLVVAGADHVVGFYDSLLVTSIESIEGDYNGDLLVDAADYTVWRDHLSQMGGATPATGDGTGDGNVTVEDYDFWKARFGNAAGTGATLLQLSSAGATAVPEPASLVLACGALVMLLISHRR